MSQIWMHDAAGEWDRHPLDGGLVRLGPRGPQILPASECLGSAEGPVLFQGYAPTGGDERWALLCAPHSPVRVNGACVDSGIRVLLDRDAIGLGGGLTAFFSTERAAEVVPFPEEGYEAFCIRCKLRLRPGTLAVRCPGSGCGASYHESPDQPCWSYSEECAICGHPTAFDAPLQWTPRDL